MTEARGTGEAELTVQGPGQPLELRLTWTRPDAPTLVAKAFCEPEVSTAWWGYIITRGGAEAGRGVISVSSVPVDPIDGVETVALELVERLREADL